MTEVVEKYIKKLYNLTPKDCKGFSEAQLLKAEKRLNITLPEEFRAYYLQLGATKSVNQSYNSLATPQQLYFAGDYLCFCEENQGVVMWAIRKEDLNNPNPPVWGNYGSETDPDWVLETQTLSDFWLYIAIYNGVMGGLRYNANAMGGWPYRKTIYRTYLSQLGRTTHLYRCQFSNSHYPCCTPRYKPSHCYFYRQRSTRVI